MEPTVGSDALGEVDADEEEDAGGTEKLSLAGVQDLRAFGHRRSRTLQMGYAPEDFMGKPVVAIINTWSDAQPCHQHFRQRAEDVKRGVWQAGFPVELPALLSESWVKPDLRCSIGNLLALEVEELLRSHPVDGAVPTGGATRPRRRPSCRDLRGPAGDLMPRAP